MNPSNSYLFSIDFNLYQKINSLALNSRKDLLGYFENIINHHLFTKAVKKKVSQDSQTIYRINYNYRLELIAVYVNNGEEKIVKFLSISDKTKLKQAIIVKENILYKVIDIDLNFEQEKFKLKPEILAICQGKNSINIAGKDFQVQSNDFYPYCISNSEEDFSLSPLLSAEQIRIIEGDFPLLLNGSGKTGKTKTLLFKALATILANSDQTIAFICTDSVSQYRLENIYQEVTANFREYLPIDDYINLVRRVGYQLELIDRNSYLKSSFVDYQKFWHLFLKNYEIREIEAIHLWDEIEYILKGSINYPKENQGLISLDNYQKQIKLESRLPDNSNYKQVYRLAEKYQQWLVENHYWDNVDITQKILDNLPTNFRGFYDVIFVDDIHNLSDLSLRLLLKITKVSAQKVAPKIAFSYDKAKRNNVIDSIDKKLNQILRHNLEETGLIETTNEISYFQKSEDLTVNLVNHQQIVTLQKAILNLGIYAQEKSDNNPPDYLINSLNSAYWVVAEEEKLLSSLKGLALDTVVIVPNLQEKERLLTYNNPEKCQRILTIHEINNYQLKNVIIWNFFTYFQDINPQSLPHLITRYLYPCVNAGEDKVFFYENHFDIFKNYPQLNNYIKKAGLSAIAPIFNQQNREDIKTIAEEYQKQGAWKIAQECYQTLGNYQKSKYLETYLAQLQGNWGKAGDLWNIWEAWEKAIFCWQEIDIDLWQKKWADFTPPQWQKKAIYLEKKHYYTLASICYQKAGDNQGYIRCLKANQEWETIAEIYQENHNPKEAEKYYNLAEKHYLQQENLAHAAKMWERLGQWEKSAQIWQKLGQWEKAAENWHRENQLEKVALCYQQSQNWKKAEIYWRELNKLPEIALACEKQSQWQQAATIWQEIEEWEKAAHCFVQLEETYAAAISYQKAMAWNQAEKCWRQLNQLPQVALACECQNKWLESAQIWESIQEWLRAGFAWEMEQEIEKAGIAYEKCQQWANAEECWRKLRNLPKIALACEKQSKWQQAAMIWLEVGKTEKAALAYEECQQWAKALKVWQRLNNPHKVALMCFRLESYPTAARIWEELNQWEKAGEAWLLIEEKEKAALAYEKAKNWHGAEEVYRELENWSKVALVCEKQRKWLDAAQIWSNLNQIAKASRCYELARDWGKAEIGWRKLKQWACVAICCERQGKWLEAAMAWQEINPLVKSALCYEKVEQWQEAEECWRQLQRWDKVAKSCEIQHKWTEAAQIWQNIEQWERAAIIWVKVNQLELAASCYEKASLWREAGFCWQKAGNLDRLAMVCECQDNWEMAAQIWQQLQKWDKAGEVWQTIEEWEKAALCYQQNDNWLGAQKCWQELENYPQVALCYEKQGQWDKAGEVWQTIEEWEKAAKAWLEIENKEKAAFCYGEGELWQQAEILWRELGNYERVAFCCQKQGQWDKVALAYVELQEWEKAAQIYEDISGFPEAEDCWRKAQNWQRVALICQQQQKWEKAGEAWFNAENFESAALAYEKAQNWTLAFDCWQTLENWERSAIALEQLQEYYKAAQTWLKSEVGNKLEKAAVNYEQGLYWELAEQCWRKIPLWNRVAYCCEQQGEEKWEVAVEAWQNAGKKVKAANLLRKMGRWREAAATLTK